MVIECKRLLKVYRNYSSAPSAPLCATWRRLRDLGELLEFSESLGFHSENSKDLIDAFKISKTKNLNICVCGSLYLAGEFLRLNETKT